MTELTDTQKENLQKLIDALRSGEYQQTKEVLRHYINGFCCLGVACDLYNKENWVEPKKGFGYKYTIGSDHSRYGLVQEVAEHYGLPMGEGKFNGFLKDSDGNFYSTLAELNDRGKSFEVIAQVLEWLWLGKKSERLSGWEFTTKVR